ncbi:MAG: hypothetical protein GKR89_12930 [Candidatus Latescibacteria bacterium]|nr:hypothetical protein [Candidatus Latescibacterota bacterium]
MSALPSDSPLTAADIAAVVEEEVAPQKLIVDDWHTHLFSPLAGPLLSLHGVDCLLTYHYVRRKLFAGGHVAPEEFSRWNRQKQGDFIWQELFVDPPSDGFDEGCHGVVVAMRELGLDPNAETLAQAREFYADNDPETIQQRCMELAGVKRIVGTQDVFNDDERAYYEDGDWDPRYYSAFRLDELVLHYPRAVAKLQAWGYGVDDNPASAGSVAEIRRFLTDWHGKLHDVVYGACSFPPTCRIDDIETQEGAILQRAVLPVLAELKLPFFMMPGPIRQLSPSWGDAGDGVGMCAMDPYQRLIQQHPQNAFFITPLHNANQYDASVMTCHFDNVMVVGHWWFNFHPGLVEADLRMRLEMTGARFLAFNSDARVMENLVPKWKRYRAVLAKVLTEKYLDLHSSGKAVTRAGIARTLGELFEPDRFTQTR